MKRKTKIACGVLTGLLLAAGSAAWWQRGNIEALLHAAQYSSDQIEEKRKENQQKVQEKVDADPTITVRDLTEEERQALREGIITQEELTEKLTEAVSPMPVPQAPQMPQQPAQSEAVSGDAPPVSEQPSVQPPTAEQPPAASQQPPAVQEQWQKDISALVARVYVLREEYTIALDAMQERAIEEYRAMDAAARTKKALMKFARSYVTEALTLEKECDSRMDEVVSAMETILRENGGDMTLVDTVVETYASEKSLKKAWYMAELEKRGWI